MKNIEHIKEIVSTQQTYARVSGLHESLSFEELIEDALRMNVGGFERHCIRVERHFGQVPSVLVDKHRVLTILLNIVSNAKHAIKSHRPGAGVFTIKLDVARDGLVEARFSDNGGGISAENLTRIFSHGFTTKQDGHGFGLHSAALAAKEMKGRLHAESEGEGCGATFVLALPPALSTSQ